MKIPINEQETVIQFDRAGNIATVDTSDTLVMTKLDKLVEKSDKWTVKEEHYSQEHELIGKCYQTDKHLISFRADRSQGHPMSDEQRQAAAERMRQLRQEGKL